MIIIELQGGIGNQLFQLAHGLFLRRENGEEVLLNSAYQSFIPNRDFALKNLGFEFKNISVLTHPLEYALGIPSLGSKLLPLYSKVGRYSLIEEEKAYSFEPEIPEKEDSYIRGFWQNYRYTTSSLPFFRKTVQGFNFSSQTKKILSAIKTSPSVAIHIRRGDYLKLSNFEVLDLDYYKQAIKIIENNVTNPHFFVFTEDQTWAQEKLAMESTTFVTQAQSDVEDLFLMSQCQHHIIANSTFSWWGTQLGAGKGKTVAPKKWTGQPKSADALLLPNWEKV